MPTTKYKQVETEEDRQKVISLYQSGLSYQKVSEKTGFGVYCINKICKEEGINRSISESHKMFHCNANYFHSIDNEHKAYWLGFLAADGYIRSKVGYSNDAVGLSLKVSDKGHIEKFLRDINSNHPIKTYTTYSFGSYHDYARVIIVEQQMVDDLIAHGVVRQKSLVLRFPTEDQVPDEFIYDYMRGYFDGNGSFKKTGKKNYSRGYSVNVLSTKEFLKEFAKRLGVHNPITLSKPWLTVDNYSLEFGGIYNVMEHMRPLYENATIYLDRKHNRYKEMEAMLLN